MKIFLTLLFTLIPLFAKQITLPKNFTSDFTQIVTNPKKKVLSYQGQISFLKPSLLKWEYQSPTQKEVCVQSHKMVLVDHDLEQVSYLIIDKEFDFVKILKDAKHHHNNVYVSSYKDQKYTIQLDSKDKIQSVAYFDNLDNKIQIVFKHMKYNKKSLSKSQMLCSVPKDFDIIQ